ncbi:MAG: glycoside hydrolase family 2 TIM barrel-domain containing protein [Bacteroidota bacterium]|nr:glycoside hydrolase family 2 TIM barrel-domain containing protein [Bacteroidota bacterium]
MKTSMIRSFILISLLCLLHACSDVKHSPMRMNFNDDWQFMRLSGESSGNAEIGNQGSDWSSQYDVSYVSTEASLSIPKEVLKVEFDRLESANWDNITLPHNPKIEDLTVLHQWQGICYYKKQFEADKDWKDKIIYLEFEGAMQLADIWINGIYVMQHAGGYIPFVIDASGYLNFGESNEILVRLDNRNNSLIPPGKPLEDLDFCYYGGIYRDVNLIVKSKIHITHPILANEIAGGGIFVTYPEVSENEAIISIQTQVQNESCEQVSIKVRHSLYQIDGLFQQRRTGEEVTLTEMTEVLSTGEARHVKQSIKIEDPKLWSPDEPYLYLLKTEVVENDIVTDWEEQRIGIRRIAFSREKGFEINGQKIRLVGSNRHMEYPYVGNAISDEAQYRDIYHVKECGFNTVRLGHYPQDISVLQACDELGVLAIEPIPGWQFFNKNEQFTSLTYRDIRHMIRRDRNHPSVIMWEVILNESWPPEWWKDIAAEVAHSEYPGDQCFTSGDSYGYFGWDVQYNDWEEGFNRPNNSEKPGFIREYYDYEFGGHYSTTRVARGDGEKALLQNAWNAQWSHNRYRAYYPWTSGDAVWSMYDYNRGCCDNICHSGVADIFRIEKFSIPFFRSQMPVGKPLPSGKFQPYIFLASYWNEPVEDNKIVVYANVDEVALFINGKELSRQKCDNGPDSDYAIKKELWYKGGESFNGGNCTQLASAPVTFTNIKWESGSIKAIGYISGKAVCQHEVKTPGMPSKLSFDYFESGKPATVNDLLIIYVRIEDVNGILCVNNSELVSLKVIEGGDITGAETIAAEAGIASFLVRTKESERLVLKAKSTISEQMKIFELLPD